MKREIKKKFITILKETLNIFLIYIPQIVIYFGLALIAYNLLNFFFLGGISLSININILISVIIVTATLSMISFTYLLVINKKDSNYNKILYCAERFLHATLLIIMALIIFWFIGYIYPIIIKLGWVKYIKWFFYFLALISYVFLITSVKYICYSIFNLERILDKKEFMEGWKSNKIFEK